MESFIEYAEYDIMSLLEKVESYEFDPTIDTFESLVEHLTKSFNLTGKNCAHSFGKKIIGCIEGNIIMAENNLPEAYFKSYMKTSLIESTLLKLMKRHKALEELLNITDVNILFGGQTGKIILNKPFQIFTVTDKGDGAYFDLVAYTKFDTNIISTDYFNTHIKPGLSHSGDIQSLLHYLSVNDNFPENTTILVGVVGYNMTPLKNFIEQNPMICIVGENCLNLVPCPLDEATLGNATFSGLFVCTVITENDIKYLEYKILPKIATCDNINTGYCDCEILKNCVINALNENFNVEETNDIIKTIGSIESIESDHVVKQQKVINTTNQTDQIDRTNLVIQIKQKSISDNKLFDITTNNVVIPFGSGIGDNDISENGSKLNLPILFGTIQNHPSVLLGSNYSYDKISASDYIECISSSHIIVHLELNGWDDFISANTCKFVGNCLFVIHLTDSEFSDLLNLTINCLTMIGPRSLVLIENSNKFYYYKGIGLSIIENNYIFGSEVQINLTEWFDTPILNVISEKNSSDIINYFTGSVMNFNQMCEFVNNVEFTNMAIELFEHNIINTLIQTTICYDSDQITALSEMIIKKITKMLNSLTSSKSDECIKALNEGDIDRFKIISSEINKINDGFNQTYSRVLKFLSDEMISTKGCVSKNHSLERLKRKIDIKKNVSATLAMSTIDICEETKSVCVNEGVVIFNVNGTKIIEDLRNLHNYSNNKGYIDSEKIISKYYENINCIFNPNIRCPQLDAQTYQLMFTITNGKERGFNDCKQSLSLPIFGSTEYFDVATMALPLYDQFINVTNPYEIKWNEKCNEPEISHFRIALRNTFLSSTECREFKFKPDSVVIGATLCLYILSFIEKYISDVLNKIIPSEESSTLKILRGSTCFLLTFMASGVNSQLSAWELFDKSNKITMPKTMENYDVYFRLIKLIPYCRWDQSIANKKMQLISKMFLQNRIG